MKTRGLFNLQLNRRYFALIGIILFIWATFSIAEFAYFSFGNVRDIFLDISIPVIFALGMGVVLAGGGIDMSMGHIGSFSAVITAILLVKGQFPVSVSIAAGLLIGMITGLFNGIVISRFGISSFIATLGTQFILVGIRYCITGGETISRFPKVFIEIARGRTVGIPNVVIYMSIAVIVLLFVMEKTVFGRRIAAVGFNIEASRLSGINVRNKTMALFVISGAFSGIAGVLIASKNSVVTVDAGDGYLLDALTMAVFSAVIFGRMKPIGVTLSAIIVVMITNGMNMLGANPSLINLAKGVMLLLAVVLGRFLNKSKWRRTNISMDQMKS